MEALSEIMKFQSDRDLDKNEYLAINEHASIFEELLESIGFDVPKEQRPNLKKHLKAFKNKILSDGVINRVHISENLPVEEEVDAYCDIVVFAVGAIMKLGYDPEEALIEVGKEINSRTGKMVDGKFEKDLSAKTYKAQYKRIVK